MKIFVEVGYYEILVRPFRDGDVPTHYSGAGGVFENHKNAFSTFDSCMNHLRQKRFEDTVVVHVSLEEEVRRFFPIYSDGDVELKRTDCGNFFQLTQGDIF